MPQPQIHNPREILRRQNDERNYEQKTRMTAAVEAPRRISELIARMDAFEIRLANIENRRHLLATVAKEEMQKKRGPGRPPKRQPPDLGPEDGTEDSDSDSA